MKRIVITSTLAFLLGAWLGFPSRKESPSHHKPPVDSAATDILAAATSSSSTPGFSPGSDDRFAKLLSTLKERGVLKQRFELAEALSSVPATDLPALLDRASKLPPSYRYPLLQALMDHWFDLDSSGARTWILSHPAHSELLMVWARRDPSAVLTDAFAARFGPNLPAAMEAAVEQLAGPDLRDQLSRLSEWPAGYSRDQAILACLQKWGASDLAAASDFVNTLPPGPLRDQAREGVLIRWGAKDPLAALAQLRKVIPDLKAGIVGNSLVTRITDMVAQTDLKSAMQFLAELPVELRANPSIAIARTWAQTDPVAALEWCTSNGIDVARGLRTGVGGWSGAVLKEAILNHPEETIAWVSALPPGSERDRLLERSLLERVTNVRSDLLFNSPDDCTFQLYRALPPEAQERTASAMAGALAAKPGFSIDALSPFGSGPTQLAAISGAMKSLFPRNSALAESLVTQFPPGPQRDTALASFANWIAYREPAQAATRALEIGDSDLQYDALNRVIPNWLQRDPQASRAWIAKTTTLSPAWVHEWTQSANRQAQ